MASLTRDALLELWLADVRANDLATGTVRLYQNLIGQFRAVSEHEAQQGGKR